MLIALDFDDTYTRDPVTWDRFIILMQTAGHRIICVTMRSKAEGAQVHEALDPFDVPIFFTNRAAKKPFMNELSVNVDVWIDDNPFWILNNARS
jgi:hypothetical protein